jgi:hypothetical protein
MFLPATRGIDLPEHGLSTTARKIGVEDLRLSTGAQPVKGTVGKGGAHGQQ